MVTVAYLTPLYFGDESCVGGGERFPTNLARGVVAASGGRVSVEILSFGPRSFVRPMFPGVSLRVMKAAYKPAHPLDVTSWELPESLAAADLLHVHQAFNRCSELGVATARLLGKPVCVTDHGGKSSNLGAEFGLLELADRVVCYSDFGASLLKTTRPIHVIKGGVDGDAFTPHPGPRARDRIVYVGRLLPHKGVDRLIRAMPADLDLYCCGRPYSDYYLNDLRRLARGKKVHFLTEASDDEILDQYSRAWATVLPSVYEDCYGRTYYQPELMGFTLLESMACGTPAVCSRVGGMPEFVDHGRTGFVYDTVDELTAAIRTLAADPDLCDEMGRAGREAIDTAFDLRTCGRKLLAVYAELLAGKTVHAPVGTDTRRAA